MSAIKPAQALFEGNRSFPAEFRADFLAIHGKAFPFGGCRGAGGEKAELKAAKTRLRWSCSFRTDSSGLHLNVLFFC